MAAYFTDKSQAYSTRKGPGAPGQIVTDYTIVAITTGMLDNANDELGLFMVPKNAVILDVKIRVTDMDSSTGLLFDLGDAGDEDRLQAAFSGQAAAEFVVLPVTGFLYKYTADTRINLYVNTAATTGVAGTVYASITYAVDEAFSTTALTATT